MWEKYEMSAGTLIRKLLNKKTFRAEAVEIER